MKTITVLFLILLPILLSAQEILRTAPDMIPDTTPDTITDTIPEMMPEATSMPRIPGTIQGNVVYVNNTPVNNGEVVLLAKWNDFWYQAASTTTDSEGNYTLDVLIEPGQCILCAYYNSDCYKNQVLWFSGGDYTVDINIGPQVLWYDVNSSSDPNIEHGYSFAVIADPHIGEGYDDYGSPGYEDSKPIGDVGYAAKRLRCAVDWINNWNGYWMPGVPHKIRFVAVLGDITDSGERSEFLKAKEILDALDIPWIPILGNHDVFPNYTDEDGWRYTLISDALPNEWFFEPKYNDLINEHPSWNWKKEPVPEGGNHFQQISFDYGYYHFVCCDFQCRRDAPIGGAQPGADLFESYNPDDPDDPKIDLSCYTWFKNHLSTDAPRYDENIIILMHHNLDNCSNGYVCFNKFERYDIKRFFINENLISSIPAQFGGHHHENAEAYDSDLDLTRVLTQTCKFEGFTTGGAGYLRVVKLYQPRDLNLRDQVIALESPHRIDFKASNLIDAAGYGTSFIIEGDGENGPKVTMTAGNNVYLEDGFHAEEGCYFRASTDFWPDDANPLLSATKQSEKIEIASTKNTKTSVELSSKETKESIPKVFSCAQNYPNPLAFNTTIKYGLPKDSNVKLTIFNLAGQVVRTLVDGQQPAGFKKVRWDGKNSAGMQVPQGIYFYTLEAGDEFKQTYKMIVIK